MRMIHKLVIVWGICISMALAVGIYFVCHLNSELSEKQAFMMLFGNYDTSQQTAIWKPMKFPAQEKVNEYFWKSRTGMVKKVFYQSYQENGYKKAFLLTKTIPSDVPYECHACTPLLSATVFVRERSIWKVVHQNLFLTYDGEYGELLQAQLIKIGPERFGALLEAEHRSGECFEREMVILVPYKKSIEKAHEELAYYDNFNGCGWSIQCATFSSKISFEQSKNDLFYHMTIKRFGTQADETQHNKAVPMDEVTEYRLHHGKYKQIFWKGYPKIKYN